MLPSYAIQAGSLTNRWGTEDRHPYWQSAPAYQDSGVDYPHTGTCCATCVKFADRYQVSASGNNMDGISTNCQFHHYPAMMTEQGYHRYYLVNNSAGGNAVADFVDTYGQAQDKSNSERYVYTFDTPFVAGTRWGSDSICSIYYNVAGCNKLIYTSGGWWCAQCQCNNHHCTYAKAFVCACGDEKICRSVRQHTGCDSGKYCWSDEYVDLPNGARYGKVEFYSCGHATSVVHRNQWLCFTWITSENSLHCDAITPITPSHTTRLLQFKIGLCAACCYSQCSSNISGYPTCMDKSSGKWYTFGFDRMLKCTGFCCGCASAYLLVEGDIPTWETTCVDATTTLVTKVRSIPTCIITNSLAKGCYNEMANGYHYNQIAKCGDFYFINANPWNSCACRVSVCNNMAPPAAIILNTTTDTVYAYYSSSCALSAVCTSCNTCLYVTPPNLALTSNGNISSIKRIGQHVVVQEYDTSLNPIVGCCYGYIGSNCAECGTDVTKTNFMYDQYDDSWVIVTNTCCRPNLLGTSEGFLGSPIITKVPANTTKINTTVAKNPQPCTWCTSVTGVGTFYTKDWVNNCSTLYTPIICSATLTSAQIGCGAPYMSQACLDTGGGIHWNICWGCSCVLNCTWVTCTTPCTQKSTVAHATAGTRCQGQRGRCVTRMYFD